MSEMRTLLNKYRALYPDTELEAGRELEKRGAVGKRARQRPDAAEDKRREERESE